MTELCCQTNEASFNGLHCFQVYVTGADGEQMVLSGPEAAALLAQAGISLGEQEQVGDFDKIESNSMSFPEKAT